MHVRPFCVLAFNALHMFPGIFSCLLRDNHGINYKTGSGEEAAVFRKITSNSIIKNEQSDLSYQLTLFRDPLRQTAARSIIRTFNTVAFTINLILAVYIKIPREEFEITRNIECVQVKSSNSQI